MEFINFKTNFFREILEELGMSEEVTVAQARKKWTQLVRRYLELKVWLWYLASVEGKSSM